METQFGSIFTRTKEISYFSQKIKSEKFSVILKSFVTFSFIVVSYFEKRIYQTCDCSPLCERKSYKHSMSMSLYPAKHVLEDLKQNHNMSEELIR